MSEQKSYKVVAWEPGAAHIIERATGFQIGYVLQTFNGWWHGYLGVDRGHVVVTERYRENAAHGVWELAVKE
jgi:hypothetical protein